jgi:hypothetical protein
MRSTCSSAVPNKWLELDLHQLKQFVYIIRAEKWLETFRTTSDEVCLMAIHLQPNYVDICLETWHSISDEFHIITNNLQLKCAEFRLRTCLTPSQVCCILALEKAAYRWPIVRYRDSLQLMKLVYRHSTYILNILNMGLNMTCAKPRNSCVYAHLTVYLYWIWTGNITGGKW